MYPSSTVFLFGRSFPRLSGLSCLTSEALRFYYAAHNVESIVFTDEKASEANRSFEFVALMADGQNDRPYKLRRSAQAFAATVSGRVHSLRNSQRGNLEISTEDNFAGATMPDSSSLGGSRIAASMIFFETVAEGMELVEQFLAVYNGGSEALGPFVLVAEGIVDPAKLTGRSGTLEEEFPTKHFPTLAGAVERLAYFRRDFPEVEFSIKGASVGMYTRPMNNDEILSAARTTHAARYLDLEALADLIATHDPDDGNI